MPKSKKKPKHSSEQKQQVARHHNEFLKKLRVLFMTVTGEDVFQYIPPFDLKLIIYCRARPISVIPVEGEQIPPKIIEAIQSILNFYLKTMMMPEESSKKPVSIADFYSAGLTLSAYCTYLEDHRRTQKNADKIIALISNSSLGLHRQFDLIYDKVHDELFPYLIRVTNSYWGRFYSYSFGVAATRGDAGFQYQVMVKQYQPEKKNFVISDNVRPAFRIGWTFKDNDFEWIFVLPPQLGIKFLPEDQHIPVYIQAHAIRRIFERIDCIHPSLIISCIYNSLRNCVTIKQKDIFIIEYHILDVKVGYLSAVMIGGKLVIRTFLFLTFNGTPEGKRLEKYIGLKMLDTKYLKMDKLSSFMTGKLKENEKLRSIFESADCLHLVELYDKLDQFSAVHPDHSPIELLTTYLETERN
jgi:hypothetical protein